MAKDGEINVKLISDSTLRHANTMGLKADIMCMSGGGLGQVTQAAMDGSKAKQNMVIIAGNNDIKNKSYSSEEEFAQSVITSVKKIKDMAINQPGQMM